MDFWEYNEHNIDDKGRLVLPSSFRSAFEGGGVLTLQGNFVAMMQPSRWEYVLRKMTESGQYSNRELNYIKSFVTVFTPDGQNRVTIPSRLRDRVGLTREVALIGMGQHIAIYPRDAWQALESDMAAGGDLDERLSDAL
ncbi:MAG: division/cell wall cluster transcriptional repressor MraZ [Microthrixaceae bacterium]